ncbi:MAG: hypothetical protein ABS58_09280 [Mesorhizobium sp. SCN 65-20]|nr:MAG: hypothetical protein ABS58_09280 [Mesorhizobium sp. SCN 65-20]
MAPLPKSFSLQAFPIEAAISEGREEDAKTMICEILRAGRADAVVQGLAADLIKDPVKRGRGRRKALPPHWLAISEEFYQLRDDGIKYAKAIETVARKFGYSESQIRRAIAVFDEAKAAHDESTAEYSD